MKTILVIDDDAIAATLIVKLLKSRGYDAVSCLDPTNGLEQAQQLHPDLILCDVVMPQMSGYELLESLRQTPETEAIPLMFLTSKSARRDVMEGIGLGADNYLSKPVDCDTLLAAVAARFADFDRPTTSKKESRPSKLTINPSLESDYEGWWVALEPESNRCFLGKTRELAHEAALRAYPAGVFFYRQLQAASAESVG